MTGLFTKLNKRLPGRSPDSPPTSDSIPIARVIHNQPVPQNASPEELDRLVTNPDTIPSFVTEQPVEQTTINPWLPFTQLIEDPLVTDIFITNPEHIATRRAGAYTVSNLQISESEYRAVCEDAESILRSNRQADDDYAIGMTIAPVPCRMTICQTALTCTAWPSVHLRLPRIEPTFYDLIKAKMLPAPLASWLTEVLATRCVHLAICGASHSGKTTLTATFAHAAPSDERIIAIEDFPELSPPSRKLDRVCRDRSGDKPVRELEIALHSSPDRIFITDIGRYGHAQRSDSFDSLRRGLETTTPMIFEFATCAGTIALEHLRKIESALPIILIETQIHERRPVVRRVLELVDASTCDLVTFHSVKDQKRRWLRGDGSASIIRQLLVDRGHELKTGPSLFDTFPEDE